MARAEQRSSTVSRLVRGGKQAVRRALRERLGRSGQSALRELGRIADGRGVRACLVGGIVRDLLLGRPCRDIDVVVEDDAIEFADAVTRTLGGTTRPKPRFGTAFVRLENEFEFELAGARRETYDQPAALPRVAPGSLRDDGIRRDFSINTLRIDLNARAFGRIHDELGGLDDLRRGRIRVLHERSFLDDPTRGFRAARLASRLGFKVVPSTAKLIGAALCEGLFDRLSSTRIRQEFARTLDESEPGRAAIALDRLGLLAAIDPGLSCSDAAALNRAARAAELHPLPGGGVGRRWVVTAGALLYPIRSPVRSRVIERLSPDRGTGRVLRESGSALRGMMRALDRGGDGSVGPAPSRIRQVCDRLAPESLLVALGVTRRTAVRRALTGWLDRLADVRADIDGNDLISAGVRRGPELARGLAAALRVKLDREAHPVEQLRAALRAARRT